MKRCCSAKCGDDLDDRYEMATNEQIVGGSKETAGGPGSLLVDHGSYRISDLSSVARHTPFFTDQSIIESLEFVLFLSSLCLLDLVPHL